MSSRMFRLCCLLFFALVTAASSLASTIAQDGRWYEFSFTQAMVPAQGCFPKDPSGLDCVPSSGNNSTFASAPPWTFTLTQGGVLTVTDAFLYGDAFEIFDNGVSIGMTPGVGSGGGCGSDPAVCVLDPKSSHASFVLGPGAYSITIEPLAITDPGSGYFNVLGTPEPTSLWLLISGLGTLAGARVLRSAGRQR